MNLSRRAFFSGLVAAPAVILTNHLMPIKSLIDFTARNQLIERIKYGIEESLKHHMFEFNDSFTRKHIEFGIDSYLQAMKLPDHVVVCNEHNNTAAVINQNAIVVDVYARTLDSTNYIHIQANGGTNYETFVAL